jgi:hypothetical protein
MSESIDDYIAARFAAMAPAIDDSTFREDERQQVDSIRILLSSLNSFIEDFRSDLELFNYAEANPAVMMRWAPIACRDAAMTLWNFRDALNFIQSALKRCPNLKTQRKEHALRAAIGRFGAAFPFAEKVRNTTAHPVGQIATPKAREVNRLRGTPVLIHNSWAGRKVMHSKEGREVSFEISGATILTLEAVRNAVFNVFRGAPDPTTLPS